MIPCKINSKGELTISRAGKFTTCACPHSKNPIAGEKCGGWCPLFYEVSIKTERGAVPVIILGCSATQMNFPILEDQRLQLAEVIPMKPAGNKLIKP